MLKLKATEPITITDLLAVKGWIEGLLKAKGWTEERVGDTRQ